MSQDKGLLRNEVRILGDDPSTGEWHFVLERGPHGVPDFSWALARGEPAGMTNYELLGDHISRVYAAHPDRLEALRRAARLALRSQNVHLLRKGIHLIAVIGGKNDLVAITDLMSHPHPQVAGDAKACRFILTRAD
jgi:hypothetical protein